LYNIFSFGRCCVKMKIWCGTTVSYRMTEIRIKKEWRVNRWDATWRKCPSTKNSTQAVFKWGKTSLPATFRFYEKHLQKASIFNALFNISYVLILRTYERLTFPKSLSSTRIIDLASKKKILHFLQIFVTNVIKFLPIYQDFWSH